MKRTLIYLILFVFCVSGACYGQQVEPRVAPGDIVDITGRIERFSYEGGFYGIAGDDGQIYKLLNLSEGYQVEGLHVKVRGKVIEKKFFLGSWGIPIEIQEIERYNK